MGLPTRMSRVKARVERAASERAPPAPIEAVLGGLDQGVVSACKCQLSPVSPNILWVRGGRPSLAAIANVTLAIWAGCMPQVNENFVPTAALAFTVAVNSLPPPAAGLSASSPSMVSCGAGGGGK